MILKQKSFVGFETASIKTVIDEIVRIGACLGIHFQGYTKVSLTSFGRLPVAAQKSILSALIEYVYTVGDINPELPRSENESTMLHRAARRLRIQIPTDFFAQIVGDEIIEIYRLDDGIQVYRNLEFMKYSSYDFATILVHSWEELFERPPEIHALMASRAAEAVKFAVATEPWKLPRHTLIERLHPNRNKFEMDMINIAPGIEVGSGNKVYWVSSLKVKPLGSSMSDHPNVRSILSHTRA